MNPKIKKMIEKHAIWLNTSGKKGKRADFRKFNIPTLGLKDPELSGLLKMGVIFSAYETHRLCMLTTYHTDMLLKKFESEESKKNKTIH